MLFDHSKNKVETGPTFKHIEMKATCDNEKCTKIYQIVTKFALISFLQHQSINW